MASINVAEINTDTNTRRRATRAQKLNAAGVEDGRPAPTTKAKPGMSFNQKMVAGGMALLGGVSLVAIALSLNDLSETVAQVAHLPLWRAVAMATTVDLGFIGTETVSMFATPAQLRDIGWVGTAVRASTILMSAAANAWVFASTADTPVMMVAGAVWGVALPLAVAAYVHILGKLVRR